VIHITCPQCSKAYRVKPELAGKKIRCKDCQTVMPVPAEASDDDEFAALLSGPSESEDQEDEPAPPPVSRRKTASPAKKKKSRSSSWSMPGFAMPAVSLGGAARGCFYTGFCVIFLLALVGKLARLAGLTNPPPPGAFNGFARPDGTAGTGTAGTGGAGQRGAAPVPMGTGPWDLSAFPIPNFPELAFPEPGIAGGTQHTMSFAAAENSPGVPGATMSLRVFLPSGEHAPGSLGCVLVPPAGTNLLVGHDIESPDYTTEYEPYVQAGFAVVHYSLDGGLGKSLDQASERDLDIAYPKFRNSGAGLANGRNAVEFVVRKLPMVNPRKIAAAGHSSAGTHVLLLAEHEPRLSAVIAYAGRVIPSPDLLAAAQDPRVQQGIPELGDFVRRSAPATHASRLRCPTFLFHAQGDDVVPVSDSTSLADMLRQQGTSVTIEVLPAGGHFGPMLAEGFPKAVAWLRSVWGQ
jgi:predicted Zn finger-like uncharacterized protein